MSRKIISKKAVFLRHEKQGLHSSSLRRYRNDYLGVIIYLVNAGLSESEPDGDDFPAIGCRNDILHDDTFHLSS